MFLWIKALHIISVICWFAMLFYLPRLFVYHSMAEDEISKERFKVMERKLLRAIGNPSMIAALTFGIWMAWLNWVNYHDKLWFWLKVFLVNVLVVYHHVCVRFYKKFLRNEVPASHVFFRWFNEVPAILLICIVILVVVVQYSG